MFCYFPTLWIGISHFPKNIGYVLVAVGSNIVIDFIWERTSRLGFNSALNVILYGPWGGRYPQWWLLLMKYPHFCICSWNCSRHLTVFGENVLRDCAIRMLSCVHVGLIVGAFLCVFLFSLVSCVFLCMCVSFLLHLALLILPLVLLL